MKRLLFLFILLCAGTQLNAQEYYQTNLIDVKTEKPTNWELYFFNEDFKIEYKFVDCDPSMGFDTESVLLKFTNRTAAVLQLNWHLFLHYDGTCRTCDYPEEYSYELSLDPNEQIEGACEPDPGYTLIIFKIY